MRKAFYLELAVPGMDKKDLRIEVKDDVLTISAEHKEESRRILKDTGAGSSVTVHSAAAFICLRMSTVKRSVLTYKDGILSVEIPKLEEEKKKEKIRSISIS